VEEGIIAALREAEFRDPTLVVRSESVCTIVAQLLATDLLGLVESEDPSSYQEVTHGTVALGSEEFFCTIKQFTPPGFEQSRLTRNKKSSIGGVLFVT
jgi:hypothetical protein